METIQEVRDRLVQSGVRFVFGAFLDLHGVPKSKCVPVDHFEDMMAGSELYTVGALEGMGELGPNEDECVGRPDVSSLVVLPWDRRYAMAAANLELAGQPYAHDTRWVLQRQIAEATDMGYRCHVGVEPEVYVLRKGPSGWEPWIAQDGVNTPTRGYDLETTMLADGFLGPMVELMNELGWDVYSFDHEGGDGQYEFDFSYADALTMADRMITFRLMAKHVARTLGCIASFMPKPTDKAFGSGAHLNVSLADLDTGANLFEELTDSTSGGSTTSGYSKLAHSFTAGVLEHAGAITAVVAPTVNSYKRLLPRGHMNEISWAPVFRAYGNNNRTLMCRLPANRRCLELRSADSAANGYLASAMVLAAGLDGVRRGLDPGDPVNDDTYKMTEPELRAAGIERLPQNLGEALAELEGSDLAAEVLGPELHATFLAVKRAEWLEYNTVVGDWERAKYLELW
jgi:glutamine synthetase